MRSAALMVLAMVSGCMESPTAAPVRVGSANVQADAAVNEAEPVADPAAPDEAAPPPEPIPELSEEDKRLIAADPKDLSPEDRRKRAYALRRKVMQNPDSPTAKALKDMEEAARRGEIPPPDFKKKQYPTLHLPGTQPKGGSPPAGHRPEEGKAEGEP
jgi:hypothetical protein